ncbi:sarcosine oxidase subunit delta [Rhodobacterales bacterium HKCCE2091]|nr:sarcosine oxidase subunit delta [Rhodobacterales bacterium HKCCE2091]
MRIPCPLCGERDAREFTPRGHATLLDRPDVDAQPQAWHNYLHLRDNPAGETRELWHHTAGCTAWLVVQRNTITHAITGASLAREAGHAR